MTHVHLYKDSPSAMFVNATAALGTQSSDDLASLPFPWPCAKVLGRFTCCRAEKLASHCDASRIAHLAQQVSTACLVTSGRRGEDDEDGSHRSDHGRDRTHVARWLVAPLIAAGTPCFDTMRHWKPSVDASVAKHCKTKLPVFDLRSVHVHILSMSIGCPPSSELLRSSPTRS